LGCAPAHKLFDLVSVELKQGVSVPRGKSDYQLNVKASAVPKGVEIGFAVSEDCKTKIYWNQPPAGMEGLTIQ
ncbi:hypothetical protein K6T82_24170, partial [Flavobacterium sp. 17A]